MVGSMTLNYMNITNIVTVPNIDSKFFILLYNSSNLIAADNSAYSLFRKSSYLTLSFD